MKPSPALLALVSTMMLASAAAQSSASFSSPQYPRPLRELYTSYFPFHDFGPITAESWAERRKEIRERVLLAAGLFPMPTRTPLNPVIHGRVERDDYIIDRVYFESFPGHYVTGSLYRPKNPPAGRKLPGILSAHGHWPTGRFMDRGPGSAQTKQELAIGAERFESGARSPLHARAVQLARMGCVVFFYDMLGYADSIQIPDHRSGRRPDLNGAEPGAFALYSSMADLRLQSNFGLQTWNSVRALDFLLTLPEVDEQRLGITGASGGGTQTLILAAIDDRLDAAFPCVMTSTAMQGGCTCENASYLRINQGNIDIAAAFAPKPMGMTAANDWTKELETKGFPDLKRLWTALGKADNVMATFNVHWAHNYNHVSRTTMYGFMNQHFNLGFSQPVFERDFVVPTKEDVTVWTDAHPKPSGDKVGPEHEKALLKHWSEDSDRLIAGRDDIVARAWEIMIGRPAPKPEQLRMEGTNRDESGAYVQIQGVIRDTRNNEEISYVRLEPKSARTDSAVVVWLAAQRDGLLGFDGRPGSAVRQLLDAGITIVCPTIYLAGAREQPMNPVKSNDAGRNEWRWAACYTYGYNPSLTVHRIHDAMSVIASLRHGGKAPARVIVAGEAGAGEVAAAAAAMMKSAVSAAVIDTGGFRFASVQDQWDPRFVPGAVKYGDLPGLLRLCASLRPSVLGENGVAGGTDALVAAVLSAAQAGPGRAATSGE